MSQPVPAPSGRSGSRLRDGLWPWLVLVAVLAAATLQLRHQGRRWWCVCGQPYLWSGDPRGPHTSQHLLDPYSFTHLLHGVLLCGLLAWGCPRLPPAWRLCLAVLAEALWEVAENSSFVIGRFRGATAAVGYQGDTVANSLGDILSCAAGFVLARRLGFWGSLALFLVTEVVLILWIKDSLLLSVLMLAYPVDAVKAWQLGR
jgi:Protein of unknown function (DUF2585)